MVMKLFVRLFWDASKADITGVLLLIVTVAIILVNLTLQLCNEAQLSLCTKQ